MYNTHIFTKLGLLAILIALGAVTNVQAALPGGQDAAQEPASQQDDTAREAQEEQDGQATANEDDETTELGEVIVTARLREEPLQEVPMAISSFGTRDLNQLQAVTVAGLQGAVPNLNIVQGRGSSSNVNIFIRGIGQPDALQSFDPGVGFYVDGVYYSRINGALLKLFDVDHIEVLRGPQGTLYGMNTTGGAIKVITKKPAESFQGSAALTVGNYGRLNTQLYLTGPISDTLSGSIALGTFKHDGYVENPATGREFNTDDTSAIRAKLEFHPSEEFNAILSVDHTQQDTALTMGHPTAPLMSTDLATGTSAVLLVPTEWNYEAQTSFGPGRGQELTHQGVSLHMNWYTQGPWSFKSITAFRELDTSAYIDIDASDYELGDVLVELFQEQFSQEIQFHYNTEDFNAVMGLYYLDEQVPSHQEAYADDFLTFFGAPVTFTRTIDDDLENTSYAGFVNATWAFGNDWEVSGGVRYTKITKDYFRTTSTFFGPPLSGFNSTFAFNQSESWDAVTPALVLNKEISQELMWYASAKQGFKAGGFNGRANAAAGVSTFKPEYVWTYESGMKYLSADGRVRLGGNVFYSDYQDFQARVSQVTNPNDPIPQFGFPVLNAAELTIYGAEFQGSWRVGSNTTLETQIGYLNAQYDKFEDPRVALVPSLASLHEHVAFTPEWTARVAATHTFGFDNGASFTLGGDVSWRDAMWLSVDNRPGLMQEAYALTGLYGVFVSPSTSWQVRAGVRNLTDEVYKTDAQEFSSVGNIQTAYYGTPRNYYVTVRYNFY